VKKWARELSREFSKEEVQMASKCMKCSTSLAIKEMQIKPLRFHLIPVRIAIIKGNSNKKYWQGCVKQEPLYTAGGGAN
jgi:hypothetical protein